jgi:hypothetical protein
MLPLALTGLWLAGTWRVVAENENSVGEYQVKAAFLYNFTQFTDWPATNFSTASAPIVIGIVGEDPFGSIMDDVVSGEVVGNHPLVIRRLRARDNLLGCHVLFISRSEQAQLPAILIQVKGHPILTVSDISDFAQQGGIVGLLLVNKKVKMEINQAAAIEAGLQISSKLLRLATIVKSRRN